MRESLKQIGRALALLGVVIMAGLAMPPAAAQGNQSPTWVFARQYGAWNIIGQQANTYTFNGGACNYTPYTNGNVSSFFVFSGYQASSAVYYPVAILDANAANSEIVTPSSTNQTSSSCGFAATTANSHTSFVLTSGTVGLQEAVANQLQLGVPSNVILDQTWYNLVFGLPGRPTPESIIKAATGNTAVQIVDATSSPWTFWRWTGSAYAAVSLTGGSSAPTAAAGAAAGSGPTGPTNTGDGNSMSVALTTGTATTTGTLFTETWATSNAFLYPPSCTVWSSGTNSFTAFTTAVTYPSATHALLTVTATAAPVASTAYQFKVVCQ